MKKPFFVCVAFSIVLAGLRSIAAETPATASQPVAAAGAAPQRDAELEKSTGWVASLNLADPDKASRVAALIATHLKAIRDWHNEHPATNVPAGINPVTGKALSDLDRQMIADSALPKSVHANLMTGLHQELTDAQVEAILDKYTIGKVAFTLNGYHSIVPDLTPQEEATILGFLKQAREEAIDYKNIKEVSAVFEIYKTKSEQFLNANGRDWKKLYKAYSDAAKAKKAAP